MIPLAASSCGNGVPSAELCLIVSSNRMTPLMNSSIPGAVKSSSRYARRCSSVDSTSTARKRFSIVPELVDDYIGVVKGIMDRHYHDVTRYTSSTFLRMKLGEALEKQLIAPQIYENADEAEGHLAKQ